jgi:hypothetical protein
MFPHLSMGSIAQETIMSSKGFAAIAALIFLFVAAAQGYRAYNEIPVSIGSFELPVMLSWVACGVLGLLGFLGLRASAN